ncbi:hypothetical protein D3C72_365670 [compost metagenome]
MFLFKYGIRYGNIGLVIAAPDITNTYSAPLRIEQSEVDKVIALRLPVLAVIRLFFKSQIYAQVVGPVQVYTLRNSHLNFSHGIVRIQGYKYPAYETKVFFIAGLKLELHNLMAIYNSGVYNVIFIQLRRSRRNGAEKEIIQYPDLIIINIYLVVQAVQEGRNVIAFYQPGAKAHTLFRGHDYRFFLAGFTPVIVCNIFSDEQGQQFAPFHHRGIFILEQEAELTEEKIAFDRPRQITGI